MSNCVYSKLIVSKKKVITFQGVCICNFFSEQSMPYFWLMSAVGQPCWPTNNEGPCGVALSVN